MKYGAIVRRGDERTIKPVDTLEDIKVMTDEGWRVYRLMDEAEMKLILLHYDTHMNDAPSVLALYRMAGMKSGQEN